MAAHVVAAARPATGATRRVFLNEAARNTASRFPRNAVSNTKYSLWSFVPRNLLEQFRCAGAKAAAAHVRVARLLVVARAPPLVVGR